MNYLEINCVDERMKKAVRLGESRVSLIPRLCSLYTHGHHFIVIVTEHILYSACVRWCACVCMSVVCGHLESETFYRLINR